MWGEQWDEDQMRLYGKNNGVADRERVAATMERESQS